MNEGLKTPRQQIVSKLVPGGHIGLFMGTKTFRNTWPGVCQWIAANTSGQISAVAAAAR